MGRVLYYTEPKGRNYFGQENLLIIIIHCPQQKHDNETSNGEDGNISKTNKAGELKIKQNEDELASTLFCLLKR